MSAVPSEQAAPSRGRPPCGRSPGLGTRLRSVALILCGAIAISLLGLQLSNAATAMGRSAAAVGTAVYYVSAAGKDSNAGTSAAAPWRTVVRVNAHVFSPGQSVLFRRGDTFADAGLVIDEDGAPAARISVGSYGAGSLPVFDGGGTNTSRGRRTPIVVRGDYVTVTAVQIQHARYAGIDLFGTDTRITNSVVTHNATGIQQNKGASRALITSNSFVKNDILVVGPGPDDDYAANGLALGGSSAEVARNTFSGHYSNGSPDYGVDGAAIEVFGSVNANIHHNRSTNDLIFVELGNAASGTLIHGNLLYSTIAAAGGVNIHGAGSYGRVTGTRLLHNTFVLTAWGSMAFVADGNADCELKNNVLTAASAYSEGAVNEAGNVWTIADYQGVNSSNSAGSRGISPASIATGNNGLVSPATGNFHLLPTSAAIDRAVVSSLTVATDFDGVPKQGRNRDSGAYEFVG
jgi:hypothetical protein